MHEDHGGAYVCVVAYPDGLKPDRPARTGTFPGSISSAISGSDGGLAIDRLFQLNTAGRQAGRTVRGTHTPVKYRET